MKRLIGGVALIVSALAIWVLSKFIGVAQPVSEFRLDETDAVVPVRITHNSEQIWIGKTLEQDYNYLVYEFETETGFYRARASLYDVETVQILGAYDSASAELEMLTSERVDPRVLAYLRRRYAVIEVLGPTGYVPIK
jgi:hypothetical protein